jgi:hypothetical protein
MERQPEGRTPTIRMTRGPHPEADGKGIHGHAQGYEKYFDEIHNRMQ